MPALLVPLAAALLQVTSPGALQAAVDRANPGDEIVVAPGEYAVNLVLRASGTAAAPIALRAGGAGVVLRARDPSRRVLELEGASHWRVRGLSLRGSRHAVVRITGGTDNVLSDCDVAEAGKKGIIANGDRITIERCWIHDIAQPVGGHDTQGIATWGATRLVIRDNRITTPGDGVLVGGAGPLGATSRDVEIVGNHFHTEDGWYGLWHVENAIDVKNVDGLLIAGNVIHRYRGRDGDDPAGTAINVVVRDPEIGGRIERVRIEGNLIFDVGRALTIDAADGPGRDLVVRWNIVLATRAANAAPRKPSAALVVGRWEGLVVQGNVFAAVDGSIVRRAAATTAVDLRRNVTMTSAPLLLDVR